MDHRAGLRRNAAAIGALLLWFVAGTVSVAAQVGRKTAEGSPAAANPAPLPADQIGYASWYGTQFHGRLTASGQVYDMNEMTAANKTLPFGTKVLVTNLENGKSCEVTINDRGPFVAGRIIDLSRAAAEAIGLTGMGVAKVRLHVVELGNGARTTTAVATNSGGARYRNASTVPVVPRSSTGVAASRSDLPVIVQVGAFRDLANAVRLKEFLDKNGFDPLYEKSGSITRVVLISVPPSKVASIRDRLAKIGLTSILIRHE